MEATILLALQNLRLPFLTQLAALVSALGNYGFVWILTGLLVIFFSNRRNVGIVILFTVIVTGVLVGFVLQPLFGHVRPYDASIGVSAVMGVSRTGFSMPSFHAATSFSAATVMAMLAGRKWGTWSMIVAALISLSRLYLGVDWPIDVLAGIAVGVICGVTSSWIYNQFLHDIIRDYPRSAASKNKRKTVNSRSRTSVRNR